MKFILWILCPVFNLILMIVVYTITRGSSMMKERLVNYPHFRSLRSGGLSVSGSADDSESPTSLECFTAD